MQALLPNIKVIQSKHPNLTGFGFGGTGSINPDEVQICIEWLLAHDALNRRKTINTKHNSYGWKHVVERATGKYVSNGAFICAALHLGYKIKRVDFRSPNAFFNIREVN